MAKFLFSEVGGGERGAGGAKTENTQSAKIWLNFNFLGWGGWGYSGVNFGHCKSEVFRNGGGIPE